MDGEVALMAALVISANHRLLHPKDPMMWYPRQRSFSRCGEISFWAVTRGKSGRMSRVKLAGTPEEWLARLAPSGVKRAVLAVERRDEEIEPGKTLPDRIAAGFAGGGSRWTMTTESDRGETLSWTARWRVGFPSAEDGRIWAVHHLATSGRPSPLGRDLGAATTELRHALAEMSAIAWSHGVKGANRMFTSALALLDGDTDPLQMDRPVGPVDTLPDPARRLIMAAQRGWVFDNMALWEGLALPPDEARAFGRASEALYDAATAALVAAANASAPALV